MSLLVHPDRPPQPELLAAVRSAGLRAVEYHFSGNPWVFAPPGVVADVRTRTRDLRVLVRGSMHLETRHVVRRIAGVRSVAHLDLLAESLAGPTLLIATDSEGTVRVQGSTTGTRAVFWAPQPGCAPVASDDVGVLARVLGAAVDLDELVVRLSDAEVNHPYSGGVIWKGVQSVEPGCWLRLAEGSTSRVVGGWTPPDPTEHLDDLAPRLQASLREAITEAVTHTGGVSTDLSGGLDSTTIAYAVHELRSDLRTVFLRPRDPTNADGAWSDRAAADLASTHHVLDYGEITATGEHDDLACRLPEGPAEAARYLALIPALETALGTAQPSVHLNGHGGDELFGALPAMPWSLVRSRNRHRLRDVLGFQRVNKQYLPATVRLLARGGTPQRDLRRIAASTFTAPYDPYLHGSLWIPPVRLPACLTTEALDRFRRRTLGYADRHGLVLHRDRTSHQIREAVLFHGALLRRMNLMRTHGSRLEFLAPLLDDRVVRTAMSLEIGDRFRAALIKPLLARGRPASMPVDYFRRRDKGDYSAESFADFRAARDRIRRTFAEGAVLEDLGLLDVNRFRRTLSRYSPDGASLDQAMRVDLAERWLRSVGSAGAGVRSAGARDEVSP
ncbi:asparagine synthase-related protein [Cellulomonas sp. Y8]|uniref:asparagine synthase-related protein n=1 Tax=Cellulomonas sp. Y8 TaxID=2591145 RepID=UPI003D759440